MSDQHSESPPEQHKSPGEIAKSHGHGVEQQAHMQQQKSPGEIANGQMHVDAEAIQVMQLRSPGEIAANPVQPVERMAQVNLPDSPPQSWVEKEEERNNKNSNPDDDYERFRVRYLPTEEPTPGRGGR